MSAVDFGALIAAARAIVARGPAEIRASMPAIWWAFEDLRDLTPPGEMREYAARCAARADEYLGAIGAAEERAQLAAARASACVVTSKRHERIPEPTPRWGAGGPDVGQAHLYQRVALQHAYEAIEAYAEAGLPAQVAEWTARSLEIESRIELLAAVDAGERSCTAAQIALSRVWAVVVHGGLRDWRRGKLTSTGVRKMRWDRKQAEVDLDAARESLWSHVVSAHEDEPIVVAARARYDVLRARLAEAPASLPTDPKELEQLRGRVPQWALPPAEWRTWCQRRAA